MLSFSILILQLEVPCLLIQWEGLTQSKDGDIHLVPGADKAINRWYQHNPCGRVVVITDGHLPPGDTVQDRNHHIRDILPRLASKLTECVIYLLCVDEASQSGLFTEPPHPGLVAFVQTLHHADLNHKVSSHFCHTN